MAKELPYFKFEPNQWENGNIQICTREDKGLFLDLCSMYWSRLGDVPFKLAVQKLCGGNATAFDSLIQEGIFTVINDDVCIDFLNEQLSEFDNVSEQNSKNAKLRWEKYRKQKALSERNATASISQCENDAIREEEIRKDKIKVDDDYKYIDDYIKQISSDNNQGWRETVYMQHRLRSGNLSQLLEKFKLSCKSLEKDKHKTLKDFKQNFVHWLNKQDLTAFQKR